MFSSFGAIAGAAMYIQGELAKLPPEKRSVILARWKAERELEVLEGSPEVKLAREYIATDGLIGKHAERLLDFARELARRRVS